MTRGGTLAEKRSEWQAAALGLTVLSQLEVTRKIHTALNDIV
jgi:hypothetical protein